MVSTNCCKDRFEPVKGPQPDHCGPVAPGSVWFKEQFGPIVVHGCPFLEAKTGLDRTFIHYQ